MSGNTPNDDPQPSSSPPVGAPTAPRYMRQQAARSGAVGFGRGRGANPPAVVPAVPQTPGQPGPSGMQTQQPPPHQTPFGGRGGRRNASGNDGRSGAAIVFDVPDGSNTRVRHPSAEAYPPPSVERQGPRVGGRIRPPPGLFQPPSGPAYDPHADTNSGRRVISDDAAYPPNQGDRRVSRGFAAYPPIDVRGPAQVSDENVIASRRRSQEILAERAAANRREQQEQAELQRLFAAYHRRSQEAQLRSETEEEKAAREEAERIQAAREKFEKGRSFEDDNDFYPGHRRNGGSI